ncbi:o-succinylbenzoate synthase [Halanaerobium saccharolyticum]|jgi:o-succinylbenzoate synthase|uniref:Dipeptide epimerase n=1 Tax=Halanaerobium saccharolyticum TaxID=43595 RepID=A0A4R6S014_9FIRM|nr:dipeptide epimerase [Halanaerobium saccharolyticum]TDP92257.1 o-succinylbenzoate synthase [Halanaerobium saccharolyticum]
MKIKDVKIFSLNVPLKKEFKTSLRTVKTAAETIIKIETDTGQVGFGEAPPTAVITGDTNQSIRGIIKNKIAPLLIAEEIENIEKIHFLIEESAVNNNSAKAAVEMAVYDLFAQKLRVPLYKILGGYQNKIISDLSISVNSPAEMKEDALQAVKDGYQVLKLKVGKGYQKDLERFRAVRKAVGDQMKIRLDANQGWQPKEAVSIIKTMEAENLNPELIEQPVKAADYEGLKFVRDNVLTPVMADESLFSAQDCLSLLKMQACDLINIKLMKAGGIYNALKINAIAEAYGIEVMLGSMLEAKVSVTAAAHLTAAKKNITRLDLDAPLYLAEDPVVGGMIINGPEISFPNKNGLGIEDIYNLIEVV